MKFFLVSFVVLLLIAGGCATQKIDNESTPGIAELFQNFSTCQLNTFSHIENNKTAYEKLGTYKKIGNKGVWFDTKQIDKNSVDEIYRFETPVKLHGLTIVAAGYSFFKGDGQGYSGGDATYWGFYFAESPKEVYLALRNKFKSVADMRFMEHVYVNMKVLQQDGDKRFDQGSIIEDDTSQKGAKSYFNCSIQYKLVDK